MPHDIMAPPTDADMPLLPLSPPPVRLPRPIAAAAERHAATPLPRQPAGYSPPYGATR
jgi:hypothetical protein